MWFIILQVYYRFRYYRWKYIHRARALQRLMQRNKESRTKMLRKLKVIFIFMLITLSLQQLGMGGYIYAKAELAQHLIESAWQKTLAGEHQVKPWSWADTWPVAKLNFEKYDIELYILAGDNGRTLAFGPGYRFGTDLPGVQYNRDNSGNSIISGHRDTHFSFLRDVKLADKFEIQNKTGELIKYRITKTEVVSVDDEMEFEHNTNSKITLVTCYPFDTFVPGGKLRYIVTAIEEDHLLASSSVTK